MTIRLKTRGAEDPSEPLPLWLLSPSEVRSQLLIVAAGTRQLAFAAGDVEAVAERGEIHPVPGARALFLGAVAHRGQLVPLLSASEVESPSALPGRDPAGEGGAAAAENPSRSFFLDLNLLAGPLLLVVRRGSELLALGFERFVGFCPPAKLSGAPVPGAPRWIKASGIIDEIPVLVVDTGSLLDYCKAPVPTSRTTA